MKKYKGIMGKLLIITLVFSMSFQITPGLATSIDNPTKDQNLSDSIESNENIEHIDAEEVKRTGETDLEKDKLISKTAPLANVITDESKYEKLFADKSVSSLDELQEAINTAPTDGTEFKIEITQDFLITKQIIVKDNRNITIFGGSSQRTLKRGGKDMYLFNLLTNAKLTLENIILDGNKDVYADNKLSIIVVQSNSELYLNTGAILQNNISKTQGGAVHIIKSSQLIMHNAKIVHNEGNYGGGICIANGNSQVTIEINNSTISNNQAINSGGGIYSDAKNTGFTLTLKDKSEVSNNSVAGNGGGIHGGSDTTVNIEENSKINNNIGGTGSGAKYSGGGIYATSGFNLTMSGNSQINGNQNNKGVGGGVYTTTQATYSITDSTIDNNIASTYGGGIHSSSISNFIVAGDSSISHNIATTNSGGGIYSDVGFPLRVQNTSKINYNESGNFGGGIAVVSKSFTNGTIVDFEDDAQLVGNKAKKGGAFWLGNIETTPYTLNLKDRVTIQDNVAEDVGGIYVRGANATITTTTPISGNQNTIITNSSALNLAYGNLTLGSGVIVEKNTGSSPIVISNESTMVMEAGSKITENTSNVNGGGIRLLYGCMLEMKKGSVISKNIVTNNGGGGGIYFYGSGGRIAGEVDSNISADSGGGIYVHGNTKNNQNSGAPEIFILDGAEIKNNTAAYAGGGIYVNGPKTNEDVDPRAVVHIQGGDITGNIANGTDSFFQYDSGGGGMAIARGKATITGGNITGNTAKIGAGGVQVNAQKFLGTNFIGSGKLTLSGGNISNNTSEGINDRTTIGIQGLKGAEITLTTTFDNIQSLKIDTSSTFVAKENASLTTIGNVTLSGNSKLITFDPNGGEVTGMENFITEQSIHIPPISEHPNYTFGGWYDGESLYQPGERITIPNVSTTYKALWIYDVTYKAGVHANSGQENLADIKKQDITLTLLGESFSRTGYTQTGWSTSENSNKVYELNDSYTNNSALILYPYWTGNTYNITFNENGGNLLDSSQRVLKVSYDATYTTLPVPIKEGYTFAGWYPMKNGSGTKINSGDTVKVLQDTELFAQWVRGPAYEVGGEITGATDMPTAYLIRNGIQYNVVITESNNSHRYKSELVPAGTYNLVVSSTLGLETVTTTVMVYITNQSVIKNVTLPANVYNSIVSVAGTKTPNIEASGLDKIAQTIGENLTGDENKVTIQLKVAENNKSLNSNDIMESIANDANYMINGIMMDLDLTKFVNGNKAEIISEISKDEHGVSLITVVFHLPKKIQNKSDYAIFRYHSDKVEKITELANANGEKIQVSDDKTIIVATLKDFSTYSIAYSDPYKLTVENGTGSGDYRNNSEIEIEANEPTEDTEFKEWVLVSGKGTFANLKDKKTVFTLNDRNTIIKATYQKKGMNPIPPTPNNQNRLTVENGTGSGDYANNSEIEIEANEPTEGMEFKEWVLVSGKGTFAKSKDKKTVFTLNDRDTLIKATFQEKSINPMPSTPNNPSSPQTGDLINKELWNILIILSIGFIGFMILKKGNMKKAN